LKKKKKTPGGGRKKENFLGVHIRKKKGENFFNFKRGGKPRKAVADPENREEKEKTNGK